MIQNAAAEGASAGIVNLPPSVLAPCTGAALPKGPHPAKEQVLAFAESQTSKLEVCDERRALAVDTVSVHNASIAATVKKLQPHQWWEFWKGN